MNYFDLIRGFDDYTDENPLSTGQIALWHALVTINNKTQWKERFTVANHTLELKTGLSKSGLMKARNALKQRGLIDFDMRKNSASTYSIIPFDNQEPEESLGVKKYTARTQRGNSKDTVRKQRGHSEETASVPLIDIDIDNRHKTLDKDKKEKDKKEKSKSSEEILSELGVCGELLKSVLEFIEHRKKIKKPMTELAIKKFIKHLRELSSDEQTQLQMIEMAIINGWQSVYLPKEQQYNSKKNKPTEPKKYSDNDFLSGLNSTNIPF